MTGTKPEITKCISDPCVDFPRFLFTLLGSPTRRANPTQTSQQPVGGVVSQLPSLVHSVSDGTARASLPFSVGAPKANSETRGAKDLQASS